MFPDVDVVQEIFSSDPLAIVRYHRAITHSFIALPFFAAPSGVAHPRSFAFAKKRWGLRDWDPPSWGILSIIYAIAIASHILLDVMTSFGTRMWYPLSQEARRLGLAVHYRFFVHGDCAASADRRVDLFGAQQNVPRALSYVGALFARRVRRVENCRRGGISVSSVDRVSGRRYHRRAVFPSAIRGGGFRVTVAHWCQAGFVVMLAYLFACSCRPSCRAAAHQEFRGHE